MLHGLMSVSQRMLEDLGLETLFPGMWQQWGDIHGLFRPKKIIFGLDGLMLSILKVVGGGTINHLWNAAGTGRKCVLLRKT